jgi:hypothetical protein
MIKQNKLFSELNLYIDILFQISSEWMQFSRLTFLLSDWNLNSKQDGQRVCLSIWSIMRPEYILKPTKEQWE